MQKLGYIKKILVCMVVGLSLTGCPVEDIGWSHNELLIQSPTTIHVEASQALLDKNYNKAIRYFQALISMHPTYCPELVHLQLIECYIAEGTLLSLERGLTVVDKFMALYPNSTYISFVKGRKLFALNMQYAIRMRLERCQRLEEERIKRQTDEELKRKREERARKKEEQERREQWRTGVKRKQQENPKRQPNERSRQKQQEEDLKREHTYQSNPIKRDHTSQNSSDALYQNAIKKMKQGDYQEAISDFDTLIMKFPDDKNTELAIRDLAICYYNNQQPANVLATIEKMHFRYPNSIYLSELKQVEAKLHSSN